MGRVNLNDLDKYNSGGGNGSKAKFFSLKDDGDTEAVHILLEDYEDIQNYTYVTHKIKLGKNAKFPNIHVNCLREYNDPLDKCPFCDCEEKDVTKASVRVFIPLWNINAEEVQFFDRPKSYISKLQKMIHRYGEDFILHEFDIERDGEKGDQQTTYNFIETDLDEDFDVPEDIPDVLGSAIVDVTADDMEYYLENGQLPPSGKDDDDEDEEPVRRRNSKKKAKDVDEDEPPFEEDEEEERPRRRSSRKVSAKSSRRRSADEEF